MRTHVLIKTIVLLLGVGFVVGLNVRPVLAASGTIQVSPMSGSYSKSFTVRVVVDGGGQAFNAAQATVSLSSNLRVSDLTLGDCQLSFLTTPGITNPSFAGVQLGRSSKNCTVYSLTLVPLKTGQATVQLSQGAVKRFGDAANILGSMHGGSYTLTGSVLGSSASLPTISPSRPNLYTVVLHVTSGANIPVAGAAVTMHSVEIPSPLQGKTDGKGFVQFANVASGVYEVTVRDYAGETILNVRGSDHTLVLGMKVAAQQNGMLKAAADHVLLIVGILVVGIVVAAAVVGIILVGGRRRRKP